MSVNMGKEASLDGLEFDGDTVLCRVCGDKASGFHYGVHACEGCKGFFRRSIQQKIQYRPCLKNQQCNIMRVNRNRCQYCRLKKCIAVGMSRDAVRFGRVPKKEKARIIEQMQKSNLQMAATALSDAMTTQDLVQSVILAHQQTSDLGSDKVKVMREIALLKNDYVDCPAHMACPLNSHAGSDIDNQDWSDFSEFFAPAIKSVVDFAKLIPGFLLLNQDDQVTLLKAATFEVLLVRMACMFDNDSNTMMFANGRLFRRQTSGLSTSVGFLLDSMFDFSERFNKLNLTENETALFCSVVLLSPDRPGLRQVDQIEKVQSKLTESLQNMINTTHKEDSTLFAKLLMKTTDLRTLNALHAEKTVGSSDQEQLTEMHEWQADNRSEDSTPSDSITSINTMTSASTMDTASSMYDSNGSLILQQNNSRFSSENLHPQQVVLKTPYGTFYREDGGYYGMMSEQPRRRCHTLDRDSQISRPRLHTIEEGSKRRATMDREYITKMVSKLSDRLEKRTHVNSMPGSVNSSTCSSPVPIFEEQYSFMNRNRDFMPISTPDSSACSSRTSPSFLKDTLQPFASSPNSPRPRSGSIGTDDFGPMQRPRCASFHVNSEGHAAQVRPYKDSDYLGADGQHYRMSADMRRGSVGASYNLHAKKKSLLVDRHPAYLSQMPDALFRKSEKQRSPLAVEDKRVHIGTGGSAFEQVTHLTVPTSVQWVVRQDKPEPPTVSVTAPTEEYVQREIIRNNASQVVSPRSSPESEVKMEELYHKKFDKLRKPCGSQMTETQQMENLTIQDVESMESDDMSENAERERRSAGEAHPQLLAQLQSGPQYQTSVHPQFHVTAGPSPHLNPSHLTTSPNQVGTCINSAMDSPRGNNVSPNNVVLTVPHAPFVNRNTLSTSPSCGGPSMSPSMANTHPCLQTILNRRDSCPTMGLEHGLHGDCASQDTATLSKIKVLSAENVNKLETNHLDMRTYQNGHSGGVHTGVMPCYDPQSMAMQQMLYQQLYMQQQGIRVSQYNEHLAGMQQMVYGGNAQQDRNSSGEIPLNLAQTSDSQDSSNSDGLTKQIKEEVAS